jgi:hypothetical protein
MAMFAFIFLIKLGLGVVSSGSVLILLLVVLAKAKGSSIFDEFLESYRFSRRLVRAIVCLLLAGRSCDMADYVFSEVALVSSMDYFLLVLLNLLAGEAGSSVAGSSSLEAELTLDSCRIILWPLKSNIIVLTGWVVYLLLKK